MTRDGLLPLAVHCEDKSCLFIALTVLTGKYCVHSVGVDYVFGFYKLRVPCVVYVI